MNPHPILVHFPIALLSVYSIFELLRFKGLLKQESWFNIKAVLVVLGAVGAVAAVFTGDFARQAVYTGNGTGYPGLDLPTIIRAHENWAHITAVVFVLLACAYIVAFANKFNFINFLPGQLLKGIWKFGTWIEKMLIETPLVIFLALFGLCAITITGALGGIIVYGPNIDPVAHLVYGLLIH